MKQLVASILLVALAGCAVGPSYQRPELETPAAWQSVDTTIVLDSTAVAAADTAWWSLYGDTVLTSLIATSLQENNEVRIAAARVEQFMGLYGVTRSDLFPKIGLAATGTRGQFALTGDGTETRPTRSTFNVNVNATWELDLWGKIRRATEAAQADVLAAEESRRGIVISIAALVATSYFDLLSLDRSLEIARQTVQTRERSLDLMRQRQQKGDVSDVELAQIESEYWYARAQIPFLQKEITQLENAMSLLIGRNPGPIPRGRTFEELALPAIPERMPSELLEQRPDVREAEEILRSANARIGVAKALYFPSISLTGLFGVASADLSNLFVPEARIWDVGGQLLQPIFRWGEISGQVAAAEAIQRQALEGYVLAVRNAFRDVEDALVDRVRTAEEVEAQANRVGALQTYATLAQLRFDEGITSYLEVLDAERALFQTQLDLVQTRAGLLNSSVSVYRALGGGWIDSLAAASYQPLDRMDPREPEDNK